MVGIDKSLEVFDDVTKLLVSAVSIYKSGIGMTSVFAFGKIMDSLAELVVDLPGAVPELMDLDAAESAKLGEAAYKLLHELGAAFAK